MDYKKMGKRIREYRTRAFMTQEKLAEVIELSAVYISQIETGIRKPSLETIIKVANALGVTLDCLVSESITINEDDKINEILVILKGRTKEELSLASDTIRTVLNHVRNNTVS